MIIDNKQIKVAKREGLNDWAYTLTGGKYDHTTIELGNLGLHNACSYYVNKDPKQYPMAWFQNATGASSWSPDHPSNCAADETIRQQFDSPLEALLDYAKTIQGEHKRLTDEQMSKGAPFSGRKRCARWCDEQKRRGLTN